MPELTDQQLKDRVQKLENLLRVSGLVHVALFYIQYTSGRADVVVNVFCRCVVIS